MEECSDNNFVQFFQNNVDFLFVLDMEGNIIEISDSVESSLGYSREELKGKSVLLVHPPEYREEAGETVRKMISGEAASCPLPLLSKSNEYVPVETRVFPTIWNSQSVLIGVSRNLSELKLSEEKFYAVFNNSKVLMAISTLDSKIIIDVNEQFLKTLGFTREEVIGKSSKALDLFYDYVQRDEALRIVKKDGHIDDFQAIIKTKSGEKIHCLFSLSRINVQTHQYVLTSAVNTTQLKNAESKIEYLYRQQKLLADISQLLNGRTDIEAILDDVLKLIGHHTDVSRVYIFENIDDGAAISNTYGWCNTGITSHIKDLQQIPYEMISSWIKTLKDRGSIFSTNIREFPEEIYQMLAIQGIKSILVYPLHAQSSFYGFIGFDECIYNKIWTNEEIDLLKTVSNIISNAFERRIVLKQLKNSQMRLTLAINSANEGLWDWYNKTGCVYFSDKWCEMLGYQSAEIEPHVSSWEKLVHPDDMPVVMEVLTKHLNGETVFYETVHRVKTKDGTWKWILDHGMVVERDADNMPVRTIGTHIDVTKQKETEQQLQESIRTKDKLFSIIAHDLRGPLGNFLPVLDVLTSGMELDETTKNNFLNELKEASENTFSLLENLLQWSKSQTNTIKINPTTVVINDLIEDNVQLFSSYAKRKAIKIAVKADENLRAFVDKDSISLVIRNLLSNAIKFTAADGIITISAHDNGRQAEVEIRDNGVGMKKEVVENLFKSTSFESTRGTGNEKGSGIGLVLCRDFIEKNGGEIRVESTPGQGSRFIFTMPGVR
ncbi:MAG: PAS domain S-box protein [Candidatus Xenobiia bacterium LiM19]